MKEKHPISSVEWVDPSTLKANDYNPNRVFSPEMRLLKTSILNSGWTQPVVARKSGEIVDGFHRWSLSKEDQEVRKASGGMVPVVFIDDAVGRSEQMMATVRHNRARGQHGILKMGKIVRDLIEDGMGSKEICELLQMEDEEVDRLGDARSSPDKAGVDSFGRGWVPDTSK